MSSTIREESLIYFLTEAQDLLQTIEQGLLTLRENRSAVKVHELMRAAHTLKGAAASVSLETVKSVAHVMEDIFRAFYNPNAAIDAEIESLLFEGYECLRMAVTAASGHRQANEADLLNRTAGIIAQIQTKMGNDFNQETSIPTSAELGFDIVQSMFEVGVAQRLEELERALKTGDLTVIIEEFRAKAEIFQGLAESLDLPGFGAIAETMLTALALHPEQAVTIAQITLKNFHSGRQAVLAGDRTEGGNPSAELTSFINLSADLPNQTQPSPRVEMDLENNLADLSLDDLVSQMEQADSIDRDHSMSLDLCSATDDLNLEGLSNWLEPPDPKALEEPWIDPLSSVLVLDDTPPHHPTIPPDVLPTIPQSSNSIRVDITQIERLNHLTGELLINQNSQTNQNDNLRTDLRRLLDQLQQHRRTIYELRDWSDRTFTNQHPSLKAASFHTDRHQAFNTKTGFAQNSHLVTQFDAIEMDRYSRFNILVQTALNEIVELEETSEVIDQQAHQSQQTLEGQQRLLGHMRDDLTHARMQPLGILLNRFTQVLKQLVDAHQKRVELILEGTEVLVDKAIIDQLYDPLLHLIRNAFDHGIESLEVRRTHGKPDVGCIKLQAYQRGNYTYIDVSDDGQGINLNKLAERAVALSFYQREQVASMPDYQLMELLFQPGFSTTTKASELSGRGMGLDVVRHQVQNLKGNVGIHSTIGQGTTFSLKIPLSLTINRLLVCETNGFTYALPTDLIERIIYPQPTQIRSFSQNRQAILLNHLGEEHLIALYSLADLIPYAGSTPHPRQSVSRFSETSSFSQLSSFPEDSSIDQFFQSSLAPLETSNQMLVLLVHTAEGFVGWRVDQVVGEQELVIRPLGNAIVPPPYIYGSSILSDSRLALVLDPIALMQYHQSTQPPLHQRSLHQPSLGQSSFRSSVLNFHPLPALSEATLEASPPPDTPHFTAHSSWSQNLGRSASRILLVIDDSLTLRRALTQTLNQAGYEVMQAQDGVDALQQLQNLQNPAMVISIICDVEMPRMNGFEFLTQFRKRAETAKIPVIMLTSRTHEKYRRIAQALGANAYFTKPYNDSELLTTLQNLQTGTLTIAS